MVKRREWCSDSVEGQGASALTDLGREGEREWWRGAVTSFCVRRMKNIWRVLLYLGEGRGTGADITVGCQM